MTMTTEGKRARDRAVNHLMLLHPGRDRADLEAIVDNILVASREQPPTAHEEAVRRMDGERRLRLRLDEGPEQTAEEFQSHVAAIVDVQPEPRTEEELKAIADKPELRD